MKMRLGHRWRHEYSRLSKCILIGGLLAGTGCNQDLTDVQTLGTDVLPAVVQNEDGAYRMAIAATAEWQRGFAQYVVASGVFTDELQSNARGGLNTSNDASDLTRLDARILSQDEANAYIRLHIIRQRVSQAVGALRKYAGDKSAALRGALYTMAAYAEVMLADMYCSGVPLSTWDFEADYTYRPGSRTDEIYRHAVALFDTAIVLAADSLPIAHMARIGKARTLLALGEFTDARAAVTDIPVDFAATIPLYTCATGNNCSFPSRAVLDMSMVTVSDGEGGRTIITPRSPRTRATQVGVSPWNFPIYFPTIYNKDAVSQVMVASGIEAALIQAEAALQDEDIQGWLSILNTLRSRSPLTDTMAAIVDPGEDARADTLFAERAQWLFLTGHRQGDLRRMIRQYGKAPSEVYPSGAYPGGIHIYGSDVTVPIPANENPNPLFHGCFDRRA